MKNKTMTLEQEIRMSFRCRTSEAMLSSEEAEALVFDLVMLDNQSVKKFLPILLLRTIPGHLDGDRKVGDLVIMLDGALLKKQKDGSWDSRPETHREELDYYYDMYGSFNVDEARCVLRWIKEVAVNKQAEWRFCTNHVISAMIFWQSIYEGKHPPVHLSLADMAATNLETLFYAS